MEINNHIPSSVISQRRETVFLILTGLFLGTLTMLNILGITRFIDLSFQIGNIKIPFVLAIGVLPYPITFLCTDFISELYGRKRANRVVWVGLILNIWVLFILWLGGALNPPPELVDGRLPLEVEMINSNLKEFSIDNVRVVKQPGFAFYEVRYMAFGAIVASMLAYLSAQFVDVQVFHFLKKRTKGKHLWLRNNVSTLSSQLIDSTAVILITYYYANAIALPTGKSEISFLIELILAAYIFKLVSALLDTIPFYYGTKWLSKYLHIDHVSFKKENSQIIDDKAA